VGQKLEGRKKGKKLVGIILALVIVLLIFSSINKNGEEEMTVTSNDTYQFQDIESMEKADSIEEAFERIFGKERNYEEMIYNDTQILMDIEMKPGIDTRMEMIDFLHYLQFSGLTTRDSISGLPPENADDKYFYVTMRVFQPIKPGMNEQEPHQSWNIITDKVEIMDFSDKDTVLGEIHRYGVFKGVNPSGMK